MDLIVSAGARSCTHVPAKHTVSLVSDTINALDLNRMHSSQDMSLSCAWFLFLFSYSLNMWLNAACFRVPISVCIRFQLSAPSQEIGKRASS